MNTEPKLDINNSINDELKKLLQEYKEGMSLDATFEVLRPLVERIAILKKKIDEQNRGAE